MDALKRVAVVGDVVDRVDDIVDRHHNIFDVFSLIQIFDGSPQIRSEAGLAPPVVAA